VTEVLDRFRSEYADAFRSYLLRAGEIGLESAYELGRKAVTGRLSMLDMAEVEHGALVAALADASSREEMERVASAARDFFIESLSPFEMTQRGFDEAAETARVQRSIAETLQRRLLPGRLPDVPEFAVAARYTAGGAGVEVGGDWYDVIPLPGDKVGLAVGDVVGRGVLAASVMGQLRIALRAYALEGAEPRLVAGRLNRLVKTLDEALMTTCVYLLLEPRTGRLSFVTAGHPPPLVLAADGTASYLEVIRCPPLGVADIDYEQSACVLEPGSTILLYTDGLIEVPGEIIDEGLERLRTTVEGGPFDPGPMCDHVLGGLLREGHRDDVAVLAVQPMPAVAGRLQLTLPADPATVPSLRRTLVRWLDEKAGASAEESREIVLAACEAASNAVEHAYGPGEGLLEITAEVVDGAVNLIVRDFGRWRPPRDPAHGRGLGIMETMMDVEMMSHADGTEVRLRRRMA